MLDLGAWASIQAEVEERHRKCVMRNDVLQHSVETAFENLQESKLTKIYDRWEKVLGLIQKLNGGNELEEVGRGQQKVEDVAPINLSGVLDESDSESEASSEVAIEDYTDNDTDTDDSDGDLEDWETISIEHDSDSPDTARNDQRDLFMESDNDFLDSDTITQNSEETRRDNETIYNSLDDNTVVVGVGLDHDMNEISDFEQEEDITLD